MRNPAFLCNLRTHLLSGLVVAALWTPEVFAQAKHYYDLAAQEAAPAIQRLAIESKVQIMIPTEDLAGVVSNPIKGEYTPLEALRLMLADKAFEVSLSEGGAIVVRKLVAGPAPTADVQPELNEIVVTGSRIERKGSDTLQATTTTGAEELARRGYTNVLSALQDTPGFASAAGSAVQAAQGNLGVAQSFADLFGLGSQRTLTLVNGRRYVSSNSVSGSGTAVTSGSQVDLNMIPVSLIDRVETVAIGGAPVYGSDAIAGTVNVILKNDFSGFDVTAQGGISERGDAASHAFSALYGTDFNDGRGHVVLSTEYASQNGLVASRRFKSPALMPSGNTHPTDGIPATMVIADRRLAVLTAGGLPYLTTDIAPQPASYIRDSAGAALQFGANGQLVPFVPGASFFGSSAGPYPIFAEGGDGLNLANYTNLLSPNKRYLLNVLGQHEITERVTAFFEGGYARTSGTKLTDFYQFAAPNILGGPTLTFNIDNPFLSDQARAILVANGVTSFNLNRNLNDIVDTDPSDTRIQIYRGVAGLRGDFDVGAELWKWDLSFNYGRSKNVSTFEQIDRDRFLQAIDVVGTPGNESCRVGGSCAPLNLFGEGRFSAQAARYVLDRGDAVSLNTQSVATANLEGRLPFGLADRVAFNLGYEHRREGASFTPSASMQGGISLLGGLAAFTPTPEFTISTNEIYGETVVPLIDDGMSIPLLKAAEFEGAVRHVDHSTAGDDLTWSAGARFQPRFGAALEGLTIRGVYTESIRAPSIVELALPSATVLNNARDVCDASRIDAGPNPDVRRANCAAALAAAGAAPPGAFNATTDNASPYGTVSGNRGLKNERAKSWSLGLVFDPPTVQGLHASLDYSSINLTDAIGRFTLVGALAACYDSPDFPNEPACGSFRRLTGAEAADEIGATRVAGDIANGYAETYFNSASQQFAATSMQIDYGIAVRNLAFAANRPGRLRFGLNTFHLEKFTTQSSSGSPVVDIKGTMNTLVLPRALPEWRLNGHVGYDFDPWDIDLQVVWASAMVKDRTATIEDTPINRFPSSTTVNMTLGWLMNEHLRLQLTVDNLLDERTPTEAIIESLVGFYNPIGRTYLLRAAGSF